MSAYLNNIAPNFKPKTIQLGQIPAFAYSGTARSEIESGTLVPKAAVSILEDILMIREFEEMIVKLRSGAYDAIAGFDYRGPTHLSIGMEAVSVGACSALKDGDRITSTHRGHGDSIARGCAAIRVMSDERLRARAPEDARADKLEAALERHIVRTAAELFGKEDGYCMGRGGGMHIADFSVGHLGANAIVGGGVPIATGAALAMRYMRNGNIVCCFAGDGAYANGVVLESLNFAAQGQFTDSRYAGDNAFGLPIIFVISNNHYGMTGRADIEVSGVSSLARRGAGFADNNMNAELVNGMDPLAMRDAIQRAAAGCRAGKGPYLIEASCYRYYGHSLSDPRNEYRLKEEEAAWKTVDPVATYSAQLIQAGIISEADYQALVKTVADRNARAAQIAAASADPDPADVLKYLYCDKRPDAVPAQFASVKLNAPAPEIKAGSDGSMSYKDALKAALIEEMQRDGRVILFGEDVADYGGAFKLSKGLLETFGRDRVFNTPISEAAICGAGVGAAMVGLRPIVELMYMDFSLMASDQIANQASKWHYMSGAQTTVPVVYRASVGGGKGYGGQHSQSLETMFAHIPGMLVAYPSNPADAKGLLKTAIRDENPVMFVESQLLYNEKGIVPSGEYLIPFGVANILRAGKDVTIVSWGPAVPDCVKAADALKAADVSAEVIDIRTLVPLDMETILRSVRKTGRCIVASQAVDIASFTAEIASRVQAEAFDYLDAPVLRIGAKNGIAPQAYTLEAAFLPTVDEIIAAAKTLMTGNKTAY